MKVIIALLVVIDLVSGVDKLSDDVLLLIKTAGYTGEAHQVETVDGYLLKVHRVLPKISTRQQFPVLLIHGLGATSADFVITGPKLALAYYLADAGYDVWLGNVRGNKHSMKHKNLSTESPEFWNFSFNEIGIYDLPAMIDYMLHTTKSSKIFYVGHSQGGTSFIVCMSTLPEYNNKIAQAHLLGPAVFTSHIPHPMGPTLATGIRNGFFGDSSFVNLDGFYNFAREFNNLIPDEKSQPLLEFFIFALMGPNKSGMEIDRRILKTLTSHLSPRVSVKQTVHYVQLFYSNKFESFDHQWNNSSQISSSKPRSYELKNISVPVYIYRGSEDALIGEVVSEIINCCMTSISIIVSLLPGH